MSDSDDESGGLGAMFTEPPRPPSPEPTVSVYERPRVEGNPTDRWSTISIRLVGSHPLWGHHLWNAARALADYLDSNTSLYRERFVLELGAGGALPGIVTAKNGARAVVLTDYPDAALVENISHNVAQNIAENDRRNVFVEGYIWGHNVDPLFQHLPSEVEDRTFDLIILSDLVFNHSQHDAMLKTCELALSRRRNSPHHPTIDSKGSHPAPCLLVFYTHHRPHLAHRDMQFFEKAREQGWDCEEVVTRSYPPMFPEDPGEEEVRATVHGWRLTRIDV